MSKKSKAPAASKLKKGKADKPAHIPGDAKGKPSKKLQKVLDAAKAANAKRIADQEAADAAKLAEETVGEGGAKKGKKDKVKLTLESTQLELKPGKKGKGAVVTSDGEVHEGVIPVGKKGKKGAPAVEAETGDEIYEAPKAKKGKKSGKGAGADSQPDSTESVEPEVDPAAAAAAIVAGKKPKKAKGGTPVIPDSDPFVGFTRQTQIVKDMKAAWNSACSTGSPVQFTLDKPIATKNYGEKLAAPFLTAGIDVVADSGTFDEDSGKFLYGFTVNPPQV